MLSSKFYQGARYFWGRGKCFGRDGFEVNYVISEVDNPPEIWFFLGIATKLICHLFLHHKNPSYIILLPFTKKLSQNRGGDIIWQISYNEGFLRSLFSFFQLFTDINIKHISVNYANFFQSFYAQFSFFYQMVISFNNKKIWTYVMDKFGQWSFSWSNFD